MNKDHNHIGIHANDPREEYFSPFAVQMRSGENISRHLPCKKAVEKSFLAVCHANGDWKKYFPSFAVQMGGLQASPSSVADST